MKNWDLNKIINIIGISVFIILFILVFILNEQKVFIGVLQRLTFAILIIYNAAHLIFTDKSNLIYRNGEKKYRKVIGIILLATGLFGFITALMGYGINGYLLFDWKTIF